MVTVQLTNVEVTQARLRELRDVQNRWIVNGNTDWHDWMKLADSYKAIGAEANEKFCREKARKLAHV